MTIWKKSSPSHGNVPPATREPEKPSLFFCLKKEIVPLRKQGEPPAKVPASFGRYYCDLCNSQFPVEELRQCSVCGRWACGNCWTKEYYLCNSCSGIAKLIGTKS